MTEWDFIDIFNIKIMFRYDSKRFWAELDNHFYKVKSHRSSDSNILFSGCGDDPDEALRDFFRLLHKYDYGIWIDKTIDGEEHFYHLPKSWVLDNMTRKGR